MSNDIIFHKNILTALDSLFADGRCPHAVLIDGSSETQREALARLTAKMIVCQNREETPCDTCEHCRKADENIHPDIITIKKPDDRKSFRKDDVKVMVSNAFLTPNEAQKKVYIISEIQNMTEESQNLLLKILEEPPVYTCFILTSETATTVISTVLSRVVRLRLGEVKAQEYSDKAKDVVKNLSQAVCERSEYDKIKATAPADGNKKLIVEVLELFSAVLRDSIALKNGGKILLTEFQDQSQKLCNEKTLKKLLDMYDNVCEIYKSVEHNPNYTLLCAVLCAKL